jgi:hypothetical protein
MFSMTQCPSLLPLLPHLQDRRIGGHVKQKAKKDLMPRDVYGTNQGGWVTGIRFYVGFVLHQPAGNNENC